MRRTFVQHPLPPLYEVPVQLWDTKTLSGIPKLVNTTVPVLLPSDFMNWTYTHFPESFFSHFCGSSDHTSIAKFWSDCREDDQYVWEHPAIVGSSPEELKHTIPWSSHGDGVPVTKAAAGGMSLALISSSSLTSIGSTIDTHFVFSALPSTVIQAKGRADRTSWPLWKAYVWDLKACHAGRRPEVDMHGRKWAATDPRKALAGQPIAGGYKLAHLFDRGDLEWHVLEKDLPHWNGFHPCLKCTADKGGNLWTDWRASWVDHPLDVLPDSEHPMIKAPWASSRTIAIDPAHTIDKGVAESLLGGVFYELIYEKSLSTHGDHKHQLVVLNTMLTSWYREKAVRAQVKQIRLQDFLADVRSPHQHSPNYSSGSMSKTRSLIPFGLHLARTFSSGSDRDRHRIACCARLVKICDHIYLGVDHPSPAEAARFESDIKAFLQHFSFLSWAARASDSLAYNVLYKHHYLVHIGQEGRFINPMKGGCCLADEDFVGKSATMCRGVMTGRRPLGVSRAFMHQYCRAIMVRWANASRLAAL